MTEESAAREPLNAIQPETVLEALIDVADVAAGQLAGAFVS
jgi:hypothetical protein